MTSTIVLTPPSRTPAVNAGGRRWRKLLVPVDTCQFRGRTLQFSAGYCRSLSDAWRNAAGAGGPVMIELATPGADGMVTGMVADSSGLWITVAMSPAGHAALRANPATPLSARITEDDSGGAVLTSAGSPASVIEAANSPQQQVIDLSAGIIEEHTMWQDGGDEMIAGAFQDAAGFPSSDVELGRRVRTFAAEMADALELAGDPGEAALIRAGIGQANEDAYGFAGDYGDLHQIDLAVQDQAARDVTRRAEDAAPVPRGSEDRLAHLLGRIERDTYAPGAMLFATQGRDELGRWAENPPDRWSSVTGQGNCGTADSYGRCAERFHAAGCGSLATPDIANELRPQMARITSLPWADENGRTWQNQYGTDLDLVQLLEARTGQRMVSLDPGGFESGHGQRDLIIPQGQALAGDFDDPDDPGTPRSAATQSTVGQVLTQHGYLSSASASRERERARADPRRAAAQALRGTTRDTQWDTSGRRERLYEPTGPGDLVQIGQPDDGLAGALPVYTRGQL